MYLASWAIYKGKIKESSKNWKEIEDFISCQFRENSYPEIAVHIIFISIQVPLKSH